MSDVRKNYRREQLMYCSENVVVDEKRAYINFT